MVTHIILATMLGAAAILLPAEAFALLLTGGRTEVFAQVVTGAWIFKGLLAVHAVLVILAGRFRTADSTAQPLIQDSEARECAAPPRFEWAILGAIIVLGASLRMNALGEGLWYDEIATLVSYARLPVGRIVTTFDSQNQHLLYSLLAHTSLSLLGDTAWAIRIPAVLFGIASIWAVYWFGTVVTTRRESLLAAALIAVSYHHVWFSQNARGYSATLFWTLVSSGLFLRLLRRRDGSGWSAAVPYAVVTALAVYTQVSFVFVTAAHFIILGWLIVRARRYRFGALAPVPLAAFVLAGTLSLQIYALVLPQFFQTITRPATAGIAYEWKNPLWFVAEMVRGLGDGVPGGPVVLAGAVLVAIAGVVSYWRRSAPVAAVMLLPAVVTAIAMLATAHNLWPRLFFFSAGFAVLIAIRGVFALTTLVAYRRAPLLAAAALIAVIAASAATTPRAWRPKQDYAGAQAFVERMRRPGDAVVTVDISTVTYHRYIATDWTPVVNNAELEAVERNHRKTWVVYTFPTRLSALQPEIWQRLERDYAMAGQFHGSLGGGAVVVKVLENREHRSGTGSGSESRRIEKTPANGIA